MDRIASRTTAWPSTPVPAITPLAGHLQVRNVISGNLHDGVEILDSGTTGNVVVGNFIGTAASGSRALPNGGSSSRTSYDQVSGDVVISGGASGNGTGWVWVGTDGQGTAGGEPGLLAGNTTIGIQLSEEGTNGNIVQGNLIGGLAGGELNFYFTSAESEAQDGLGLAAPIGGLGSDPPPQPSQVPSVNVLQIARLADQSGSALDLVATFVTLTVVPGNLESELESADDGAVLLASFVPGGSTGLGQGLGLSDNDIGGSGAAESQSVQNPTDSTAGRLRARPSFASNPGLGSPPALTTTGRSFAPGCWTPSVPVGLPAPPSTAQLPGGQTVGARLLRTAVREIRRRPTRIRELGRVQPTTQSPPVPVKLHQTPSCERDPATRRGRRHARIAPGGLRTRSGGRRCRGGRNGRSPAGPRAGGCGSFRRSFDEPSDCAEDRFCRSSPRRCHFPWYGSGRPQPFDLGAQRDRFGGTSGLARCGKLRLVVLGRRSSTISRSRRFW